MTRSTSSRSPTGCLRLPARMAIVALALVLSSAWGPASAQRKERLGKEVVEAVCGACHVPGANGAPKIGDGKAWSARAGQGLAALNEHALKGIRNMPAHGGSSSVSDIEIERAIIYMVNQSGGKWIEPLGGATPTMLRGSEQVVQGQCAKCHQAGLEGAPKIGDRAAWIPRLKKGLDALVASAIHGHGAMPARGGLPDLSDEEIRGAIVYMFNFGIPAAPPQVSAPPADPYHKLVAGTDVYLGVISAERMRAANIPGRTIPSGKNLYHVNISLADAKTKVPVTDAEVTVKVSDVLGAETSVLELIAENNTVSYGGFFHVAGAHSHTITAQIRRPGTPQVIEARFEYKAR